MFYRTNKWKENLNKRVFFGFARFAYLLGGVKFPHENYVTVEFVCLFHLLDTGMGLLNHFHEIQEPFHFHTVPNTIIA